MDFLRRIQAQWREFWGKLTPFNRNLLMGGVLVTVVALASVGYLNYSSSGKMEPLVTNASLEETGQITAKLKQQNVPYKLESGGTTIMVPEGRAVELRVALANEGVLTKTGKGLESFEDISIGTPPFATQVKYISALQTELSRSISQLEPIASARVIIARAEPSPFIKDRNPTTASVVVKLKPGYSLNRSTAASIVALVSRSVEGLKQENVTIVDSSGRLLSDPRPSEDRDLANSQIDYRRDLENYLSSKAEEMLSRHLGQGRAIVKISVDLDLERVKEKKEDYSIDKVVAREQTTSTNSNSAGGARGIPGTGSNLAKGGSSSGGGGNSTSREETINTEYLVPKTTRETERRTGEVKRLTIAAMVDLSSDEGSSKVPITLADAQEIIKQAVGFRQGRDDIKVSDVKLTNPVPITEVADEVSKTQRILGYVSLARNVALSVAVVALMVMMIMVFLTRRKATPIPAPEFAAITAQREQDRQREIQELTDLARQDPDRVAKLITSIMGGEARP